MTKQFEVGKTYSVRSYCDHNCIFSFKVVGRTAKTIKIEYHGKISAKKLRIVGDTEQIYPLGTYSMAPALNATDTSDKIEAEEARRAEFLAQRAEAARARRGGFIGT